MGRQGKFSLRPERALDELKIWRDGIGRLLALGVWCVLAWGGGQLAYCHDCSYSHMQTDRNMHATYCTVCPYGTDGQGTSGDRAVRRTTQQQYLTKRPSTPAQADEVGGAMLVQTTSVGLPCLLAETGRWL